MRRQLRVAMPVALLLALAATAADPAIALAVDPMAANNGLYPDLPVVQLMTASDQPTTHWDGTLRLSNYDYPKTATSGWLKVKPKGALTLQNAAAYVNAMKQYVAPSLKTMINDPNLWSHERKDWYSSVWTAAGSPITGSNPPVTNPSTGREAILGSSPVRSCAAARSRRQG